MARLNDDALRHIAKEPDVALAKYSPDLAEDVIARLAAGEVGDPAAHLGDHAPHPTHSHPPDRQRIESAGVRTSDALMAQAARPIAPAEVAAAQNLFRDWANLSTDLNAALRDRARQRPVAYREHLQAVAGQTDPDVTALHEALLRPTLLLALLGLICVVVAVGCILAALYSCEQDRQAWGLLTGVAIVGAIGLGFVTF